MKAKNANRVLTIDSADKDFYKAQGYDIVELDQSGRAYKVIEKATGGKTFTVGQYNEILDENESLKKRIAELENNSEPDREDLKKKLEVLGVEFANNTPTSKLIELLYESEGEIK